MTDSQDKLKRFEDIVANFRKRAFVAKDFSALDEYLTEDFTDHFAPQDDPEGRHGVLQRFSAAAEAFDTQRVEVLHSMTRGNVLMQAIRIHLKHTGEFMGIAPTFKELWIGGFDAFEFRGDKLAGHWGAYDVTKLPDQLGAAEHAAPNGQGASWNEMWKS